jgi:hypothetical protein
VAYIREWPICKQRYLISLPHKNQLPFRLYGLGSGLGGPLGGWMNDNFGWCVVNRDFGLDNLR